MTREEAKEILEEVKAFDDSIFQYNQNYMDALDIAIKTLESDPCEDAIHLVKNLNIRFVDRNDKDYPLIAMVTVPDRDKYDILKIGNTCFVPLFQVIDKISIPPDYIVKDGKKYCPNCGAKMESEN